MRSSLPPDDRGVSIEALAADVEGWDSGVMVAIVLAIEERFGFEMSSGELESLEGVADLLRVTRAHLADRAS